MKPIFVKVIKCCAGCFMTAATASSLVMCAVLVKNLIENKGVDDAKKER